MEPRNKIGLWIDDQEVEVAEGTTVLEAARQAGIDIPTLCHHPALSAYGGCRLCMVEVDEAPRLLASCVTPVRKGMSVVTTNDRIFEHRRTIIEFLLSERPHYCMYCAQSGDCEFQTLAYRHRIDNLTVPTLDQVFPVDATREDMVIDHNRCVLCGRCVRACRELAGASVLDFHNRGGRVMIGMDLADKAGDSSCMSCGACLQVCPTGAIFHRHRTHYAVHGKDKDWRAVESFCPECGLLCPATFYVKDENLIKIESPLEADGPGSSALCRIGRFGPMKTERARLAGPMVRKGDGSWSETDLAGAIEAAAKGLTSIRKKHGGHSFMGLVSSRCSEEELEKFSGFMVSAGRDGYLDTIDGNHYRTVTAAFDGSEYREISWKSLADADFILEIGADTNRTHPVVQALTRRAVLENGAALAVLGEGKSQSDWAAVHIPAPAEALAGLTAALLAEVYGFSGIEPPADILERWGGPELQDVAQRFKMAACPVVVIGEGLTGGDPAGVKAALGLARLKSEPGGNPRLIVLKPAGNSAGAWRMGVAASVGANGKTGFKGGLVCLSGEDGTEPDLAERLKGLKFLAVITPYVSKSLLEAANVLIPKPTWLEAEGTFALADGSGSRSVARILQPPANVPPALLTLAGLAQRLGGE